jgi:tetratricopeptide (TPR) repeat protein/tRNA A-37 threonylcarbamoyl transferase component Bud32
VVRHALQRGYLSGQSLDEALRLQASEQAAGRPQDLLTILRARYLRPELLPELSGVYRAAESGRAAAQGPAQTDPAQNDSAQWIQRPTDSGRPSGRNRQGSAHHARPDSHLGSKPHPAGRSLGDTERTLPAGAAKEARAPTSIAGYRIVRELARGAFGIVYHAHSLKLDRPVALKLLRHADMATEEDFERFQIEARAAARLRHANIVGIHDVGQDGERHYLVMDLIEGETLKAQIEREGSLDEDRVAEIGERLCEALYYAHSNQILHRDLKPANILLNHEGQPLLTDFGLAKDVGDEGEGLTATGQAMGTPAYMPPEQAAGALDRIDRRSDVYSLGATLYEALAGKPPFSGPTALATMNAVVNDEVPALSSLRPGISRDLETVIHRCLEKEPSARYDSANLLGDELRRFRAGEPTLARPLSPPARLGRWLKRNPVVTGSVLILGLGVGAGGVAAYFWKVGVAQERAKQEAARVAKIKAEVTELVDSVESERLTSNDDFQRVFYDLVRRTEPEAVEVMVARLDSVSQALAKISRETYLEADALTPAEKTAGLKPIPGLEAAVAALAELRPGEQVPPQIAEPLAAAGQRIAEREYARFRVRVSGRRAGIQELIASRQGRLSGELSAARLLLFVLARLEGEGIDEAIGRYLLVEADPARSVPAGQALRRMKSARAKELLFWARDRYGTQSDFWRNLKAGRGEDLSGLQEGQAPDLESAAGLLYQAELDYERKNYETCVDRAAQAIRLEPKSVRAWILRARAHWALKDYRGALDDARKVIELDPQRPYGWIVQGQSLEKLDYKDQAIASMDEAVSKNADQDWAYRERGALLRTLKNPARALEDTSRAVKIGSRDWRNYEARAMVYLDLRRFEAAEADFLEAVGLDANFYQTWLNLSVARWELGKFKLAEGDATRALRLVAGDAKKEAKVLSNRAVTYQSMGNFEAALGDLDSALERAPKVASAWATRGALRGMLGRYKDAIADLDQAIELEPKGAEAWLNRGLMRAQLGADTMALVDIGTAIRLNPKLAHAYAQRGEIYSANGQLKEAHQDFQTALNLRPKEHKTWFMLGIHYERHRDYQHALQAYDRGLSYAPEDIRLLRRRGRLYARLSKTKEALADFGAALAIDPSDAEIRKLRAKLNAETGQIQAALEDYTVALRSDPKNHILWISRAAVYHHIGKKKLAREDLDHAASVAGQSAEMWQERALLEGSWGDHKASLKSVGRAVALGAGKNPRLFLLRAELREAAGEITGAIEDFERFLRLEPDDPLADQLRQRVEGLRAKSRD